MSLTSHKLSDPSDLPSFLSQLNGSYDQLSIHQTRDLLSKIESWRASHAETEFRYAQNMYNDVVKKRRGAATPRSEESRVFLDSEPYNSNAYADADHAAATSSDAVTELKRKKQELLNLLEKGNELEAEHRTPAATPKSAARDHNTTSDHIPRHSRPSNAPSLDADTGIVTVSANTTEADTEPEYNITKEDFKKPKKPRVTIPKPFSFDSRERTRRKTISERRFEEYINSLQQQEDDMINRRFIAQPVPASTLEAKYKDLQEQSKARSEEIKEMSKKWLIKTQRPFGFMQNNTYEENKKRNLEKIEEESKFVRKPFKANPVPEWMGEKMMHTFEAENVMREKRVKERAKKLYEEAALPPRMEMWKEKEEELKAQTTPNRRHSSAGAFPTEGKFANPNFTFHPRVNTSVPNFSRLQKEFENELKRRKEEVRKALNQTTVQPPKCADAESLSKSRLIKILTDIKQDEENLPENRWPYLSKRRPEKPNPHPDFSTVPKTPDKTKTILMREELVKKHLENLRKAEERRRWEEENVWFNPKLTSTRKSLNTSGEHSHLNNRPSSANPRLSRSTPKAAPPSKEEIKKKVLSEVTQILKMTGDEELIKRVSKI